MPFPSTFLISPLENVCRTGQMRKNLCFSFPEVEARRHWRWEAIVMDSDIYLVLEPKTLVLDRLSTFHKSTSNILLSHFRARTFTMHVQQSCVVVVAANCMLLCCMHSVQCTEMTMQSWAVLPAVVVLCLLWYAVVRHCIGLCKPPVQYTLAVLYMAATGHMYSVQKSQCCCGWWELHACIQYWTVSIARMCLPERACQNSISNPHWQHTWFLWCARQTQAVDQYHM